MDGPRPMPRGHPAISAHVYKDHTRKYVAKYVEDLHSLVTPGLQPISHQVDEARDRFVGHCCISWLMLMTTARSLGDHDTEELAEQGYRDCARLVMRIDHMMPSLVIEELHQDGFAAQDAADWAQRIVSDAWTREQIGSPIA